MKKVFLLSKQNISLAAAEVLSLTNPKDHELYENMLILETDFNDFSRLAYTRAVYDLLFIAYKHNFVEKMQKFEWQKIYKGDFCLRIFNADLPEKELAGHIWNAVKDPKVNLKNPKTEVHIFKVSSKFFCCLLNQEIKQDFESRRAHLRPALLPTSMHPRLARALVNLTGVQSGQTLLDPFCGSGGILIEAALIGCNIIGYDIDPKILDKTELNLTHYNILDYTLKQQDALKIKNKFEFIATDLPYGINTPSTNLKELYLGFLKNLQRILKRKAVVVFPDFVNYKKLINKTKLKLIAEFDYYIHKSLTKKIVLLEK